MAVFRGSRCRSMSKTCITSPMSSRQTDQQSGDAAVADQFPDGQREIGQDQQECEDPRIQPAAEMGKADQARHPGRTSRREMPDQALHARAHAVRPAERLDMGQRGDDVPGAAAPNPSQYSEFVESWQTRRTKTRAAAPVTNRKKPKKMQQMHVMDVDLQQRTREATQPDVCPYAAVRGIRWRSTKKKRRGSEFNAAACRWSSRFSVSPLEFTLERVLFADRHSRPDTLKRELQQIRAVNGPNTPGLVRRGR